MFDLFLLPGCDSILKIGNLKRMRFSGSEPQALGQSQGFAQMLCVLCLQGQAAAGQALEEAMAATREAAQRVDATVSILRQVQVSESNPCEKLFQVICNEVQPNSSNHVRTRCSSNCCNHHQKPCRL